MVEFYLKGNEIKSFRLMSYNEAMALPRYIRECGYNWWLSTPAAISKDEEGNDRTMYVAEDGVVESLFGAEADKRFAVRPIIECNVDSVIEPGGYVIIGGWLTQYVGWKNNSDQFLFCEPLNKFCSFNNVDIELDRGLENIKEEYCERKDEESDSDCW